MSITDIVDGVMAKVAADPIAPAPQSSGLFDQAFSGIRSAMGNLGRPAQVPQAPQLPPSVGADPTLHSPVALPPAQAPQAVTPPVAPIAPADQSTPVKPAATPTAPIAADGSQPSTQAGLAKNEQGLTPAQIATQRAAQYKSTHPATATPAAPTAAPQQPAGLLDQLKSKAQSAAGSATNAIIEEAGGSKIDVLKGGAAAGMQTDDLLGSMKERWGNIAVPLGLALMFFGGNMGKLAGGILAAAGGANIYGRIQEMQKPETGALLDKMSALKGQKGKDGNPITPFTNQAYEVLAANGVTPAQLAVLRDVHAATLVGGLDVMHKAIVDQCEKKAYEQAIARGENQEGAMKSVQAVHASLLQRIRAGLPPVPDGAKTNYVGSDTGLKDTLSGWIGSDMIHGMTNPAQAQ